MTPQQLKAMKQALEALKLLTDTEQSFGALDYGDNAITALEEVLAEHAMQEVQRIGQEIEQEPVAECPNLKGESMNKDEALTLEALKFAASKGYGRIVHEMKIAPFTIKYEEALAQPEQEPVAVYGYCPECGAKGVMRERRPNGNDKCANGHTYPSSTSTPPQRTWVGLTDDELLEIYGWRKAPMLSDFIVEEAKQELLGALRKVEAKLKEKNT